MAKKRNRASKQRQTAGAVQDTNALVIRGKTGKKRTKVAQNVVGEREAAAASTELDASLEKRAKVRASRAELFEQLAASDNKLGDAFRKQLKASTQLGQPAGARAGAGSQTHAVQLGSVKPPNTESQPRRKRKEIPAGSGTIQDPPTQGIALKEVQPDSTSGSVKIVEEPNLGARPPVGFDGEAQPGKSYQHTELRGPDFDPSKVLVTTRSRRPRMIRASRKVVTAWENRRERERNGIDESAAESAAPQTLEELMNGPLKALLFGVSQDTEGEEEESAGSTESTECGSGSKTFEESQDSDGCTKSADPAATNETRDANFKTRIEGSEPEVPHDVFDISSSDDEASARGTERKNRVNARAVKGHSKASRAGNTRDLGTSKDSNLLHPSDNQRQTARLHKSSAVMVNRKSDIQEMRMQLPVCEKEQEIVEAVLENDVVLIQGAAGSGKTTQVPQFLYEAGFGSKHDSAFPGRVVVSQPRRLATVSCASRVAEELNVSLGHEVGFQYRGRSVFNDQATRILFMTDGILLREIEADFTLQKYSCIILDEVHERSVNIDVLLTLLSRAVPLRRKLTEEAQSTGKPGVLPLKLIIMSATPDLEAILDGYRAPFRDIRVARITSDARQYPVTMHFSRMTHADYLEEAHKKICRIHRRLPPGDVLCFVTGQHEVMSLCARIKSTLAVASDEIFATPPRDGTRTIVVATNVAETSITIPGVRYVVDSGRVKQKVYRSEHGSAAVSSFSIGWTSKASAAQRAGRAGRTAPGHCYRLFSAAVFENDFEDQTVPETLRVPVDSLVLSLRALGIIDVAKFPLPSPPSVEAIDNATELLRILGAFDTARDAKNKLTNVGEFLAQIPVAPRSARFLWACKDRPDLLALACTIAGCLGAGGNLVAANADSHSRREDLVRTKLESHSFSEWLLNAELVHSAYPHLHDKAALNEYCARHALNVKSVLRSLDTAQQLRKELQKDSSELKAGQQSIFADMALPITISSEDMAFLIQAFLGAFADQVARKMDKESAAALGLYGKWLKLAYSCPALPGEAVFIPVHFLDLSAPLPEFVSFSGIVVKTRRFGQVKLMENVVPVKPKWIANAASACCSVSNPLDSPPPRYDPAKDRIMCFAKSFYGSSRWNLGVVEVPLGDIHQPWKSTKFATGGAERDLFRFRVFAHGLLEGLAVKELLQFKTALRKPTNAVFDSIGDPLVVGLVQTLHDAHVSSRHELLSLLSGPKHDTFLLLELRAWYDASIHSPLGRMWAQISAHYRKETGHGEDIRSLVLMDETLSD
ncbi:Pre-mRNA-splicing factor ATP-dependent RNA helicase DEAH1 [Porphyridium purpureum]|uniref:RNA helicase n=1 Tax=Porphyridium purpureum TaxID=35688 RepID=A0A5J4YX51_PORPP|nr:Pre-mRNA-splicing factor ATP-dependent RNA helicase DEAH1 [Porphyridium purpureum]|eukprot:POR0676..scf209_3